MRDGSRPVVAASNHGYDAPPAWYLNMLANPLVTVEDAGETYEATAVVTEGADRERLLEQALTGLPFVAEYQANTARRIELVALERRS
jgi:deazaflavin-dependent oxidoreductase (nitroreductase family)